MGLLTRLQERPDAAGIRLQAGDHGSAEELPPPRLLLLAGLAADVFRDAGAGPGDRIVTILPTGRALLQAILGAWYLGGVISVLAPSIDSGRSSLPIDRLKAMLGNITPKVIVGLPQDETRLAAIAAAIGARFISSAVLPAEGTPSAPPQPNGTSERALIQFTSGSTGLPKPIVISHGQILKNVEMMAERIDFGRTSIFVSWLPLHHDMGLVGGLMMPLALQARLILLATEAFLRNPTLWLATLSETRATHSSAPPFACRLLSNSAHARRAAKVDLTSLSYLAVAAEAVSLETVRAFEETYAGCGLRPGAVRPGYGMAEATLTVSCTAPFSARRIAWIDREAFRKEGRVVVAGAAAKGSMPLLSNGAEISEMHLRIADADGNDLPEGQQGRVLISGACVTHEYFNSDEDPQPGGWLDSGDLGFLLHGELYISGRSKDVIIRGGHNVHAHEIEEFVLREFSENCLRAVAFAIPREDDLRDELVLGLEFRRVPAPDNFELEVTKFVSRELGIQIDQVIPLPKGAIPRTTSGKLQRSRARDLYRAGELLPSSEGRENA